MFCTSCGNVLTSDAVFCTKCGSPVNPGSAPAMQATPGSMGSGTARDYIERLASRLQSDGFEIQRDAMIGQFRVLLLAEKKEFEATKFGRAKKVVAVASADTSTVQGAKNFLSVVLEYSRKNPTAGFLVNQSNFCFPVILYDSIPQDVKDWVMGKSSENGRKSFGFPVVVSLKEHAIHYSDKTPLFGAIYYGGFRDFAKKNLDFG